MKKIIYTIFLFGLWFCSITGTSSACYYGNTIYHKFYLNSYEEAMGAWLACVKDHEPGLPDTPNVTCSNESGVTNFWKFGGCWVSKLNSCPPGSPPNTIIDCHIYCYYYYSQPEELPAYDCKCNKEDPKSGQQCAYNYKGDPINILTGAYRDQETDLQFNTTFEKGFELYRSFHSRVNTDSPFGYSWTHNYNVLLETFGPPDVYAYQIHDEANLTHYFQDYDGDGLYTGILSTKGGLKKETDGTFTWNRSNGIRYSFNTSLKLTAKKDTKDQFQTLTYDANNRLASVTDQATGRSLGFVYNAEGRIEQITGPITTAVPEAECYS